MIMEQHKVAHMKSYARVADYGAEKAMVRKETKTVFRWSNCFSLGMSRFGEHLIDRRDTRSRRLERC